MGAKECASSKPMPRYCIRTGLVRRRLLPVWPDVFTDPTAEFITICRCLGPNIRLAFVCWGALEENPLDILPLRAAHFPPQPAHDPDEPGPFAFASDRGILERAGFVKIEINAHDEQVGSGDVDAMFDTPAIEDTAGCNYGDGRYKKQHRPSLPI
jgi:hypothetical protein